MQSKRHPEYSKVEKLLTYSTKRSALLVNGDGTVHGTWPQPDFLNTLKNSSLTIGDNRHTKGVPSIRKVIKHNEGAIEKPDLPPGGLRHTQISCLESLTKKEIMGKPCSRA